MACNELTSRVRQKVRGRIAVAGMLFLGLLAGCPWHAAAAGAEPQAPRPLPADLALVSPDALAFVHLRVADLWQSEVGKAFRQMAPEGGRDELQRLEWAVGVSVDELECVTLVVAPPSGLRGLSPYVEQFDEPRLVAILRTLKPYSRQRVLDAIAPGAREEKYRDTTVHVLPARAGGGAVYFADERVFAAAERIEHLRPVLRHALRARSEGPLGPALATAQEKHFLVAGASPAAVQMALFRGPGMRDLAFMLNRLAWSTERITLKVALADKEFQANLEVACFEEREARAAVPAVRAALALLRETFAEVADELAVRRGLAAVARTLQHMETAVADGRVEQRGARVTAAVALPLEQLGTAMAEGLREAQQAADRARSANNLKQLGIAMLSFETTHKKFPSAIADKEGKPLLSWRVAILPYLEQEALYRQFRLDEPWDSAHNKKLLERMPEFYTSPGAKPKQPHTTFYQAFDGPGALFGNPKALRPADIRDGLSNTIMVVEAGEAVPWTKPQDLPYDPKKPLPKLGGVFSEGFHVLFCDGAVHFCRGDIDPQALRAAITAFGGEAIDTWRLFGPARRDLRPTRPPNKKAAVPDKSPVEEFEMQKADEEP
jgi:hypothetical protein